MVRIDPPPPHLSPHAIIHTVPIDTRLIRVFDPTAHSQTALTFRAFGPLRHFDHHRAVRSAAVADPERSIYIDGILYANAHNGGDAVALYERAVGALQCDDDFVMRLDSDDSEFRALLQYIGLQNHILVPPIPRSAARR